MITTRVLDVCTCVLLHLSPFVQMGGMLAFCPAAQKDDWLVLAFSVCMRLLAGCSQGSAGTLVISYFRACMAHRLIIKWICSFKCALHQIV